MKDYKKIRCVEEKEEYFTCVNTISNVIEKEKTEEIPYEKIKIDFDREYKKSGVTKRFIKLYEE